MSRYVLSIVTWRDSAVLRRPWYSFREVRRHARAQDDDVKTRQVTVGYLIRKTRHFLVFCQSLQFEDGKAVAAGGVMFIPRKAVIDGPEPLDLPRKWRKKKR